MKAFQEVVDTLSKDEDYTFPKAGLGSSAIAQIIRKHMDERRRKETEMKQSPSSHSESDASSTSGENSPESGEKKNVRQLNLVTTLTKVRYTCHSEITTTNYCFFFFKFIWCQALI